MPASYTEAIAYPWDDALGQDLVRFFRHKLGCPDTAADLAQEAQLRLWQNAQGGPIENPRAFAFRVAVNLLVDHRRRQAIRENLTPLDDEALDDVPSRMPLPDHIAEQGQRFAALETALAELPERCRAALLLNRIEGLSHREIAAQLGVSESMVGKYLAQALRHCRTRLNP